MMSGGNLAGGAFSGVFGATMLPGVGGGGEAGGGWSPSPPPAFAAGAIGIAGGGVGLRSLPESMLTNVTPSLELLACPPEPVFLLLALDSAIIIIIIP